MCVCLLVSFPLRFPRGRRDDQRPSLKEGIQGKARSSSIKCQLNCLMTVIHFAPSLSFPFDPLSKPGLLNLIPWSELENGWSVSSWGQWIFPIEWTMAENWYFKVPSHKFSNLLIKSNHSTSSSLSAVRPPAFTNSSIQETRFGCLWSWGLCLVSQIKDYFQWKL